MRLIYYLFISMTSLSLISCYDPIKENPCPDSGVVERNISSSGLSTVPYTGYDTLYFLNRQGDTCILKGMGRIYEYDSEYSNGGSPSCPPQYLYRYQKFSNQFVSLKGNFGFYLELVESSYDVIINRDPSYSVDFRENYGLIAGGRPDHPDHIDSMTINGIVYRDVFKFEPLKKGYEVYDSSYQMLYNKEYGLLYMKSDKENEEFSIIPKM